MSRWTAERRASVGIAAAWMGAIALGSLVSALPYSGTVGERYSPLRFLRAPGDRPDIWIVPVLEWAVIVGTLAWVFLTGGARFRAVRRAPNGSDVS
jgi:hypothetical protein